MAVATLSLLVACGEREGSSPNSPTASSPDSTAALAEQLTLTDPELVSLLALDDPRVVVQQDAEPVGLDPVKSFDEPDNPVPALSADAVFNINEREIVRRAGDSGRLGVRYGTLVEDLRDVKPPDGVTPDSNVGQVTRRPVYDFTLGGLKCTRSAPAGVDIERIIDCSIHYYLSTETGEVLIIWEQPLQT